MEIHADDHIVFMAFSAVFLVLALLSTQRLGKFTIIRWLRHSYIQLRRHTLFQRRTVSANMDRCVCVLNFTSFGDVLVFDADECHTRLHSKYWVMAFGLRNYTFLDDRFRICPGISTIGKFSSVHCSFPRVKLPSRIMWLRGSKKSSQVKKKTINWKIEAIRGTKKWFEDESFSMRLPSLLKNF